MSDRINLVKEFHKKFHAPVANKPTLIDSDRSEHRYQLIQDEVKEYQAGVKNADLENVAKELVDILYATYGAILEHGLQDDIDAIFAEVHRSNMSKDYHEYKMVKGSHYTKADLSQFFQDQ